LLDKDSLKQENQIFYKINKQHQGILKGNSNSFFGFAKPVDNSSYLEGCLEELWI